MEEERDLALEEKKEMPDLDPDSLKQKTIPQHVAIIMDGNGRWAESRGLPRIEGHREGIKPIRKTVEACAEVGVRYLTLYTFSTENWNRPDDEVNRLMELLEMAITEELPKMYEHGIRLETIGDTSGLPKSTRRKLEAAKRATSENTDFHLILALNYGGRSDILRAVIRVAREFREKGLEESDITEEFFSRHLSTDGIPDPDLIIRTSGEMRLSNFLLWEAAYTELWFTSRYWPDFDSRHFYRAIRDFQNRDRRYGEL